MLLNHVAMYMAAQPCPPLPLAIGQQAYENSHDVLASLLLSAMQRPELNASLRETQRALTAALLERLASAKENVGMAYEACTEFTVQLAVALGGAGVRVLPMARVAVGDRVHRACCSWQGVQEALRVDKENVPPQRLHDHLPYEELLRVHCLRFCE